MLRINESNELTQSELDAIERLLSEYDTDEQSDDVLNC